MNQLRSKNDDNFTAFLEGGFKMIQQMDILTAQELYESGLSKIESTTKTAKSK